MAAIVPSGALEYRYLHYWLVSNYQAIRNLAGGDKRDGLNLQHIGGIETPLPPRSEQVAIADYLDHETGRIDTLIAKQEQLIATLRERRTSRLFDLVTHGTERSTHRRPSSLDWVDEVPAHWTELNIRRVAEMRTGHTPSRSAPEYWEHTTIPWFTLADVWQLRSGKVTYLRTTANNISELGLANSAADLLPAGTVVLSRTASVGFSGITPTEMATSQDFWNWICGPRLAPKYLMFVFRAMRNHLLSLMIGSTHKTIYQPVAAAIRIPLPHWRSSSKSWRLWRQSWTTSTPSSPRPNASSSSPKSVAQR
jgi:type I restriction enzyme S subunit